MGINRAENFSKKIAGTLGEALANLLSPCIFISYMHKDKNFAIKIGDYIKNYWDMDIYLDVSDEKLQFAVEKKDPKAITQSIEDGINRSDYVLCIFSEETKGSWWVPYEIGYAKKSEKELFALKLKNIDSNIPDYLKIVPWVYTLETLDEFLKSILPKDKRRKDATVILESIKNKNHFLKDVLDE